MSTDPLAWMTAAVRDADQIGAHAASDVNPASPAAAQGAGAASESATGTSPVASGAAGSAGPAADPADLFGSDPEVDMASLFEDAPPAAFPARTAEAAPAGVAHEAPVDLASMFLDEAPMDPPAVVSAPAAKPAAVSAQEEAHAPPVEEQPAPQAAPDGACPSPAVGPPVDPSAAEVAPAMPPADDAVPEPDMRDEDLPAGPDAPVELPATATVTDPAGTEGETAAVDASLGGEPAAAPVLPDPGQVGLRSANPFPAAAVGALPADVAPVPAVPAPGPVSRRSTDLVARPDGGPDAGSLLNQVWFPDSWPVALTDLATRAQPEDWHEDGSDSYEVLASYLRQTWRRLIEEGKVLTGAGRRGEVAALNTGLFTDHFEPIHACLEANTNPDRQPWVFKEWAVPASARLQPFDVEQLLPAFYFTDPAELIYDPRLPLVANLEHMVDDNVERYPAPLQLNRHQRRLILDAAVRDAGKAAQMNWRTAIPQFYRSGGLGAGRIQLLLPLCLTTPGVPDLALAVDRGRDRYRAHTVLTLAMARKNARLLARPEVNWLRD